MDKGHLPAHLVHSGRGEAGHVREIVVGEQPHHQAGGMPAGSDEPVEGTGGGEAGVGVDGLGIELLGEADYSVLGDREVAVLVHRSGLVVLEVAVVDGRCEVGVAQSPGGDAGVCHVDSIAS
jgi:hypothetical protein